MPLTGGDHQRLDDAKLTLVIGGERYMRMQGDAGDRQSPSRCIALCVVAGRFVCSVYHSRPEICHELERGSPACLEEMNDKTARALRVLG